MYAYPARGYFSVKKSNQKSPGEGPETPYASEPSRPETLRIPGAGLDDAYKVPQAHFMWGLLQTNSRKSCCRAYGLNKLLFAQTAPPPLRGRGRGCEAERRQWRMQRGGAPAAVEKNEQASSAKFFSGTARRRGQIRRGYLWSASVRSTDLDFSSQKNLNP